MRKFARAVGVLSVWGAWSACRLDGKEWSNYIGCIADG
jgi:hypothetical protein